jgi:uncharacterized coiled-coil protein SlyX
MLPTPNFFQISFAVRHENHPVVKFVQSQANVLEEFVSQGILQLSIEPSGEDFDYYVYTYEAQLEARIQKLTTSIALYSVEIDKMDTTISAQRDRIAQLEAENAELKARKCSHGDYRVIGTDACKNHDEPFCNGGRTELYVIGDGLCVSCNHALAKIEAMRGGGNELP